MPTNAPARRRPPRDGIAGIVLYPLQPACLTSVAALALGMTLSVFPLVGNIVEWIVWAAALHYAVEVFQRSAHGSIGAPEFAHEPDGIGWKLLWLQLAFSIGHWLLVHFVDAPVSRGLGIGLIALLQPAMTLTAAMNRTLASALNPARVLRVIGALAATYAPLVAAGVGMGLLQEWAGSVSAGGRWYLISMAMAISNGGRTEVGALFSGNGIGMELGIMAASFVCFYGLIAYFRALGLAVNARSDALGFEPMPQRRLRPEDHHAPLLQRVEDLASRQQYGSAAQMLGECLATQPYASVQMHERYRDLLRTIDDQDGLIEHARMRIDALLAAGSTKEALTLAREALAINPDFRPAAAERTTALAQAAVQAGQPGLALDLLRDFSRRHPRDPAIPDNALLAARLQYERHGDPAGARDIVQQTLDRMLPAHPRHAELTAERERYGELASGIPAPLSKR